MVLEKPTLLKNWIEPFVDVTTFGAVELFSLMSRQIAVMHPYAVGSLTIATSHALSIAAAKKLFNPQSTEAQIAATVMGLALSTIALPYIIGKWAIHSVIRLNFETSVRTAVTSLLVKTTVFTLYTLGKSLVDQYHWETPKKLKDLDNLGTSQLQHVKAFFMDHTDQKENLTLALQHALTIPLGKCSGIGDGWTKESLQAVQGQDLSFLTLEQKKELNRLFLQNHLLPSKRDYVKEELPSIPESLSKLSLEQLTWTHLIAQLSDTAVSPELAKQFYEQGFYPAKTEWIDWALPIQVELLSKTDLSWVKNDLIAHPEKWRALDLETQRKLKEKITLPYLVFPQTKGEVNALTVAELKSYWEAFKINNNLKKEFPLEMRRVFAARLEKTLGCNANRLFTKGEERDEPYYLFGRVTPKQALAVGFIVMVVAVPALAAIGSLYYGASTTPPSQEPMKESKNQTQEIILPPPVEELSLSKIDLCPDHNCLMIPSGSKVIDYPVATPNITVHDQSWTLVESINKVDDFTLQFLAHQKQTDPRDPCPERNCLELSSSHATCKSDLPTPIEPFAVPFTENALDRFSIPLLRNATKPVITEEFSSSELSLTDRTITEIDSPWKDKAPNRAPPVVHEDVCSVDAHALTIPEGSQVIDHQARRISDITVKDRSWEPSLKSTQKVNDFCLSILPAEPYLMNKDMTRVSFPFTDPTYNATCETPHFATPPVCEPIVLPPPQEVIITPLSENQSFSIFDSLEVDFSHQLPRGTSTAISQTYKHISDQEQGSLIWSVVSTIGAIATLGLLLKRKEKKAHPLIRWENKEIAVVNRNQNSEELANQLQNAQYAAINIQLGDKRIQVAFDPNDLQVQREFYRMMHQTPRGALALEGEGSRLLPLNMSAQLGMIGDGMRTIFNLDLSHPVMAHFIQGLVIQARAHQPAQMGASQRLALGYEGSRGVPQRLTFDPRTSGVRMPPLGNVQNRFPELRVNYSELALNRSLMGSLLLEDGPIMSKEAQEFRYVAWSYFIGENGHPAKMRKYRVVLDEYLRVMREQFKQDPLKLFLHFQERSVQDPSNTFYRALFRALETLMCPIDPRKEYLDASTQRYTFVQSLRGAILSSEYQAIEKKAEEALSSEEKLCRDTIWVLSESFFRPEIYNYLKEVTDLFVHESRLDRKQAEDDEKVTAENFVRKIDGKNTDIKKAPKDIVGKSNLALQYQKACGAIGCEDFIGTKNTPHLRNQYVWQHSETGENLVVDYFRHGCPVLPGNLLRIALGAITRYVPGWIVSLDVAVRSGESVAPEYEQMLRAKAARREGDLYVNHQRRIPGGVENEWDRVEAIEGLQITHPNEFVLTQSVEGTLFKRQGPFAKVLTFEGLIDAFIQTYSQPDKVGNNAENMLPRVFWDRDYWGRMTLNAKGIAYLKQLKEKLTFLHLFFFDGRKDIAFDGVSPTNGDEKYPLREWQVFIELCYSFMRKDLLLNLSKESGFKITSMKDICKDKLDRGGNEAKNEDEIAYYMIGDLTDVRFEETLYQLLGPPILVKKKEAIPKRLQPGLAMSQFLYGLPGKKKDQMKQLGKQLFEGWEMKDVVVQKRKGQKAFPTKETARTKEEYRAYLYSKGVKEASEVDEVLRKKFDPVQLKEASEPEEVYTFLKQVSPKVFFSTADAQVQANVKHYQEKSSVNSQKLYGQINKDLSRDHGGASQVLLNGKAVESAKDLFAALSKCSKSQDEVLGWMSLIQQGLFGGIEDSIWNDLDIKGFDSGFQIRGHGPIVEKKPVIRTYNITTHEGRKPEIFASSYYELIANDYDKKQIIRDQAYAVLLSQCKIDLEMNQAVSTWRVDEIIGSSSL
ncbi:hypothetical protein [Simkania negevensis]|uniref:Uncharacterized protein n=1 Tax=Simkania negevensis (strain ATCC VR-1471 / DSM 27360 / Z) TaxID=331113 RepID=F8L7X5_SIMNZ|nr:hypothetical protein [Simkania negevensis]CCB88877.1 unknown protein [Simkania negevensis Z]